MQPINPSHAGLNPKIPSQNPNLKYLLKYHYGQFLETYIIILVSGSTGQQNRRIESLKNYETFLFLMKIPIVRHQVENDFKNQSFKLRLSFW